MKISGSKLKFVAKIFGFLLGFSALGFLLIAASYTLPRGGITKHIAESSSVYLDDARWAPSLSATWNDRFSDSLILGTVAYDKGNSIEKAALTAHNEMPGQTPMQALDYFTAGGGNTDEASSVDYARYWHGYLIFLAPLLEFFNPAEIIFLNIIAQLALIVALAIIAYRRYGLKLTAALLVFVFSLNPLTVALNFQYSAVFYPTIIALILILLFHQWLQEKNRYWYFFLLLGCATVYLDLLTYPLVSLGAPLALVFYLCRYDIKKARDFLPPLRTGVLAGACWALGYIGTWALKWGISSLVLGRDMFSPAIHQIMYRSGNDFGHLETIRLNFVNMFNLPMVFIFSVLAITVVALLVTKKLRFTWHKWSLLPYIILVATPFFWYYVVANHSFVHHWFTYRVLSIAVFAAALAVASSFTRYKRSIKKGAKK